MFILKMLEAFHMKALIFKKSAQKQRNLLYLYKVEALNRYLRHQDAHSIFSYLQ